MNKDELAVIEGALEYAPEIGDMVLFHTPQFDRPAVITHVWSEECVNLCVFPDGSYDAHEIPNTKTSVMRGDGIGQWSPRPFEFLETIEIEGTVEDDNNEVLYG
mgnify:CR=1 FL=1